MTKNILIALITLLFSLPSFAKVLKHPTCYLDLETSAQKQLGVYDNLEGLFFLTDLLAEKGYTYLIRCERDAGTQRLKLEWDSGFFTLQDILVSSGDRSSDPSECLVCHIKYPDSLPQPSNSSASLSQVELSSDSQSSKSEDFAAFKTMLRTLLEKLPRCVATEKPSFKLENDEDFSSDED